MIIEGYASFYKKIFNMIVSIPGFFHSKEKTWISFWNLSHADYKYMAEKKVYPLPWWFDGDQDKFIEDSYEYFIKYKRDDGHVDNISLDTISEHFNFLCLTSMKDMRTYLKKKVKER